MNDWLFNLMKLKFHIIWHLLLFYTGFRNCRTSSAMKLGKTKARTEASWQILMLGHPTCGNLVRTTIIQETFGAPWKKRDRFLKETELKKIKNNLFAISVSGDFFVKPILKF